MGNNPRIDIVAKMRYKVTDDIICRLIHNFERYNAEDFTRPLSMRDTKLDGFRRLSVVRRGSTELETIAEAYSTKALPSYIIDDNLHNYEQIICTMRFTTMNLMPLPPDTTYSVSSNYPFTLATMITDFAGDTVEAKAKYACGPAFGLIRFDDLMMKESRQEVTRIIPNWDGLSTIGFNHFTYSAFRSLNPERLQKAFLMANVMYLRNLKNG